MREFQLSQLIITDFLTSVQKLIYSKVFFAHNDFSTNSEHQTLTPIDAYRQIQPFNRQTYW